MQNIIDSTAQYLLSQQVISKKDVKIYRYGLELKGRCFMTKKTIAIALFLVLMLALSGCGTEAAEGLSASSEASYTKITNSEGDAFYLDDSVVDVAADAQADAKEITDRVRSYVSRVLVASYYGRLGVVDGDFIAASGLEAELDARIGYIAEKYKDQGLEDGVPYLRITQFAMQDDAAKVLVDFALHDPETDEVLVENQEAWLFIKDGRDWKLINNIVDTGRGGDAMLEEVAASDDPGAWRTVYSFEQCKRSDYEDAQDFSDFLAGDGKHADPDKVAAEG